MIAKCVAYTFEQSKLSCILHSSTDQGLRYTRGKQTGIKKANYILSLPEISFCADKNRKRRCRSEPKCNHVNCLRNALDCLGKSNKDCWETKVSRRWMAHLTFSGTCFCLIDSPVIVREGPFLMRKVCEWDFITRWHLYEITILVHFRAISHSRDSRLEFQA